MGSGFWGGAGLWGPKKSSEKAPGLKQLGVVGGGSQWPLGVGVLLSSRPCFITFGPGNRGRAFLPKPLQELDVPS